LKGQYYEAIESLDTESISQQECGLKQNARMFLGF